jgi:histidinol phosphatase-like PHP family hydrolase
MFSDGKLTPEEVCSIAKAKGYLVGISDHCGEGSFQINSDDQFRHYLQALEGLAVFKSAELDLGTQIAVSPHLLGKCDYLIGGVHSISDLNFFDSQARLPASRAILEQMLGLIETKAQHHRFQILAHPGLLPSKLRPEAGKILDNKWSQRLVELALKYDFALEISSRWELPSYETIQTALKAGVRFSLGSDGHGWDTACRLDYSLEMVEKAGIRPDRIFDAGMLSG